MLILKDVVLDLKFKILYVFFYLIVNKRVIDCEGLRLLDMWLIFLYIKLISIIGILNFCCFDFG